MARQPISPPRKRRTRAHVLADLSANHVEKIALGCGYAVDRVWHDYGLDLAVFTFDKRGYLESGVLWIQLKATVYPITLVMYDAANDRAYWLLVQSYFAFGQLRGKTITVPIPTANVLNEKAMREFARRKAAMLARHWETDHEQTWNHI